MNSRIAAGAAGWSNGRFGAVAVALFVLQGGLIWCFAEREHKAPPVAGRDFALRPLSREMTLEELATAYLAEDPTLYQTPSLHGFSGRAWMQTPGPEYHGAEAPAPDVWLSLSNSGWSPRWRAAPPVGEAPLTLAPPPMTQYIPTPAPPPPAEAHKGGFSIEGALGGRRLLGAAPTAAPQVSAELLKNTVVQIAADASGQVITACVIGNSGSPAADATALGVARRLRFVPLNGAGGGPDWGRVVFAWQTVPPPQAGAGAK